VAVCAVVAFTAAFFAAGADTGAPPRRQTHPKPVSFTDPAASAVAVAVGAVGRPTALKLPPPRPHVKHHSTPAVTPVTPAATTPTYSQTLAPLTPRPEHRSSQKKSPSGTGHGVTTIP